MKKQPQNKYSTQQSTYVFTHIYMHAYTCVYMDLMAIKPFALGWLSLIAGLLVRQRAHKFNNEFKVNLCLSNCQTTHTHTHTHIYLQCLMSAHILLYTYAHMYIHQPVASSKKSSLSAQPQFLLFQVLFFFCFSFLFLVIFSLRSCPLFASFPLCCAFFTGAQCKLFCCMLHTCFSRGTNADFCALISKTLLLLSEIVALF